MSDDLAALLARADAVLQEAERLRDELLWQRRLALRQALLSSMMHRTGQDEEWARALQATQEQDGAAEQE